MAYDEYRERRRFERESDFEPGQYGRRSFGRSEESRWPGESSWGYGREYDEGYPERYRSGQTRSFEGEGRPELTRGATEFHPEATRRYGVETFGRDFGWQPEGGYGQGGGYLYGWSPGAQGFYSPGYRTPERWRTEPRVSSDWWTGPRYYSAVGSSNEPRYYGTARHLSTIPRGRFTGLGPKGYQRSDERIREDVSEELWQSGEIDASEVAVEVTNGVVTLDGEVEDRDQKRLAEDIAEAAPGVRDVRNNLKARKGFFARLFGTEKDEERSYTRESR